MLLSGVLLGMTPEKSAEPIYQAKTLWMQYNQHCLAYTDTILQKSIYISTYSLGGLGEYSDSLGFYPYGSIVAEVGNYYTLTLDRIYAYNLSTGEEEAIEKRQTLYIPKTEEVRIIPLTKVIEHRYIFGFEGELYCDSLLMIPSKCKMDYCLSSVERIGNALRVVPSDGDCEQFADSVCKQSLWVRWTDGNKMLIRLGR